MAHRCRGYFCDVSIEYYDSNFSHMPTNVFSQDRTHREKIKQDRNWKRNTTMARPKHGYHQRTQAMFVHGFDDSFQRGVEEVGLGTKTNPCPLSRSRHKNQPVIWLQLSEE